MRSPEEIIRDHLDRAQSNWNAEADFEKNFHENVVFLTSFGKFHGKEGGLKLYERLTTLLPNGKWEYKQSLFHGEMGFLRWNATSDTNVVEDGADSYFVKNGKIAVMTIHYTAKSTA